jgi:hypothetical protein
MTQVPLCSSVFVPYKPPLYIGVAKPHMSADLERWWCAALVTPTVHSRFRYFQEFC